MTEGKVFISYRRDDSAYAAGRLYDRLSARFGEENIFMDVEGLDPGVDFFEALNKAVSACDVLIALIGKQWLEIKNENDQRRLDSPEDFVRIEISAALDRDIRVIPILVHEARMPGSRDLPPTLRHLARLNAFEIRHDRFNADVDRLARSIEKYCKEDAERQQRVQEIAEQETQIAECLATAQAALKRRDWETAQSNYRLILKLRPAHITAKRGLQIASKKIEARMIEEARQTQTLSGGRQSLGQQMIDTLSILPRKVWYLGGSLGLILMLVLACWGGYNLYVSLLGTQTPQPIAMTTLTETISLTDTPLSTTESPTPTNTLPSLTTTATFLPVDTVTPDPTIPSSSTPRPTTATSTSTNTATPIPTITPTPTQVLPAKIVDDKGISMALVPAGSFDMGSDAEVALVECQKVWNGCERRDFVDEEPIHTVTLDSFYIDQYEVTNAQFAVFLNEQGNRDEGGTSWYDADAGAARIHQSGNIWQANSGYADHPATEMSWYGARAYCVWRGGRLPTEAEWEKAARGGLKGELYPWGRKSPVCDPGAENGAQFGSCKVSTAQVGSFGANGYGLYDMAGNVREWVADWYDSDYYTNSPQSNPTGPENGDRRVVRGGCWDSDNKSDLWVTSRRSLSPSWQGSNLVYGFRCARSP